MSATASRRPKVELPELERHREFSIAAMTILPELIQTRDKVVDPVWSKRYADLRLSGSEFPEVALFYEASTGRYILGDGHTRVHAAQSLGLRAIPAVIRAGGIQEAMLYGIERNLDESNWREVTKADRRRAVEMMIRNGAGIPGAGTWDWSDTEIGRRCGNSNGAVRRCRLHLNASESIPLPERTKRFTGGIPTATTPYLAAKDPRPHKSPDPKSRRLARRRFVEWAEYRRIALRGVATSQSYFGGYYLGDCAVEATGFLAATDVLSAVGRLTITAGRLGLRRRILIAPRPGSGTALQLANITSIGIEVMTQGEFLAEFGPGEGGAEPAGAEAEDVA